MIRSLAFAAALLMVQPQTTAAQSAPPSASVDALAPALTAFFEADMRERHIPGLVFGVVKAGRLVLVRGLGVQDIATKRPVTADTRFRIASMSKAFTALSILALRDAGKLSLDAPAERYLPEMAGWRYPTSDAPRIRVADLLHHSAGFVEDNPWGDRQQPLTEPAFTTMLRAGVPFANAPGVGMEYSNLGYAMLGRIVSNVGGLPYQQWIGRHLLAPLGMTSTGYDVLAGPQQVRALGYRWQDGAWLREPDMADGAFGAMGGLQTSANDYARWVAFLLSGWPARDGPDAEPVRRATVREIVEGANFVDVRDRHAALGQACRQPVAYAKGWSVVGDCDLGRVVTHTGGYPGYGSVVALLPDAGVGVFAFANRTYAAPSVPAMQALLALRAAGLAPDRRTPVSSGLAAAYAAAQAAWRKGDATVAPLAINVLLDRDADRRRAEIAGLKRAVGDCGMDEPIAPVSAMEGHFVWTCATGRIAGRIQRAPTPALSLQVLDFQAAP
ncbi:serine hydrolase domain-containing protein [Sphingomonas sp. KR1UV-12]|uniref:Serine hydrolase domain-containing protein n=1 Tax=Sphingomonas aurea TaxID=3063994 RepID=A0ABT9EGF3_9SPHN|nr:serine hydrolase domain-containing protein [Sphingomonas sp. KR1UV-12]MDP1026050.1 serine hydrolase domain-containing protein [Sphingomonas sp. KR1UV-12]